MAPITMPKFNPIPAITGIIRDSTRAEFLAILVNSSGATKVSGCLEAMVAPIQSTTKRITTLFSKRIRYAFFLSTSASLLCLA